MHNLFVFFQNIFLMEIRVSIEFISKWKFLRNSKESKFRKAFSKEILRNLKETVEKD